MLSAIKVSVKSVPSGLVAPRDSDGKIIESPIANVPTAASKTIEDCFRLSQK